MHSLYGNQIKKDRETIYKQYTDIINPHNSNLKKITNTLTEKKLNSPPITKYINLVIAVLNKWSAIKVSSITPLNIDEFKEFCRNFNSFTNMYINTFSFIKQTHLQDKNTPSSLATIIKANSTIEQEYKKTKHYEHSLYTKFSNLLFDPNLPHTLNKQSLDKHLHNKISYIEHRYKIQNEILNDKLKEINEYIDFANGTRGILAINQQANYFKESADYYKASADKWFAWILSTSLATIFFAILMVFMYRVDILNPLSLYESIQLAIGKVMIFAILIHSIALSSKNYISNQHNMVINLHRQNALNTFKKLIDQAENSNERDAILEQATYCIFNPQPTGFTLHSGSDTQSSKSVLEILEKTAHSGAKMTNKQ